MRVMFWIMVVITSALLAVSIARPQWLTWKKVSTPERTSAAAVASRPDPSRVFAGGIVEGSEREVTLRFEIAGRVTAVFAKEGDVVKAGTVLAELDAELLELQLFEARTQLQIAQIERDRLAKLAGQQPRNNLSLRTWSPDNTNRDASGNPISRNRLPGQEVSTQSNPDLSVRSDRTTSSTMPVQDELSIADSKVALAESAVKLARLMLAKTQLRSPIDGVVLRAAPEPGELVAPTDEREMFTIANRDRIRVRAFVEELDALNVAVGQRANIAVVGRSDRQYLGQISNCSPHVRPKSHRHLKPGERLDVRVREIVIDLSDGSDLLVGLPVEVFIDAKTKLQARRETK